MILEGIIWCGVVFLEMIGVLLTMMLVQGIVYWTTGFSIYRWMNKKLFAELAQEYKTRK